MPKPISRRTFLCNTTAGTATLFAGQASSAAIVTARADVPEPADDLKPLPAVTGLLAQIERYPLVALTERHMLQEWHDFMTALLFHPALPGKINDIVIEFGSSAYQDLADRFLLHDSPVSNAELQQIWRQIGDPVWNAPVYAQFFRSVRAVNWMLPKEKRIRVLLGQAPATMDMVLARPDDVDLLHRHIEPMDSHYVQLVEREVLARGRRALLTGGGGHMLRGLQKGDDPHTLNAVGRLAQRHPGKIFVIDLLLMPMGINGDPLASKLQASVAGWPRPALAHITNTWLGATTRAFADNWVNSMSYRAFDAASARYDIQADAVLYLGSGEALTASRPDPAVFRSGEYPAQLNKLSDIISRHGGPSEGLIAMALRWAEEGPRWFKQSGV
jgi:hypothetical protein